MAMTLRPRVDGPPAPAPAPSSFPLAAAFEQRRADIEPLLPKGVTLSRVVAELYLAWRRNPDLAKVPVDKLVVAVGRALATGGVIDQDVYIVPMGSDAVTMTDYKFKVELVIAAGGARSIEVRAVWDQEPFEIHYGTDARIVHQPLDAGARGKKLKGAYAIARIRADIVKFEWMDIVEIEAIRANSKSWGPRKIAVCPAWYAKKTVVHQLVKLLPKSPRLREIAQIIQDEEREEFALDVTPPADSTDDDLRMVRVQAPEEMDQPTDISDLVEVGSADELREAQYTIVNKRALGDIRNSGLAAIRDWAQQKANDPDVENGDYFAWIQRACTLIVEARAAGTLVEPPRKGEEPAAA